MNVLRFYLRTRNSLRGFVRWSVRWSVVIESISGKTRISAPAHLSATGSRVSGLVIVVDAPLNVCMRLD